MAREKRSFPFSEFDIPTTNSSENKWKKRCFSSEYLKKNDHHLMTSPEDIDMEYENCAENGQIAFEDFQNGYDSHVQVRFENGNSLQQTTNSMQTEHCQSLMNNIQNGHSLQNGTLVRDNNNSDMESSVCVRCQAGEPGHIGHIGR
ncbi:uncharacterized protein LOC132723644 isoform X2 [Ruditapes philippinarum]|uniref:uncharacterized protein LOC132723644 isoform X2 n=1 Tax=Ruditapes philippinarum TaxID=129788 RepID=UPI00295B4816|nr:uncharacterized protein LOC132723644 isoform X2 [Ruditapes philippinarum]